MESTLTAYRRMPKQSFIAREGFPFLAVAICFACLFFIAGYAIWSVLSLMIASFIAFFFRNPERKIPKGDGLILAPADGRVISVADGARAPYSGRESKRISIFMSVFDVHVNRFPVGGTVEDVVYHAGRFFVASLDKASESNERNVLLIRDRAGREFVIVQIAGLIARRIVCYFKKGDRAGIGERLGLIRFGSRVDLYVPPGAAVSVKQGDKVKAGESIVGRFE